MSNVRLNRLQKQNSRQEFQSSGELFRPEYEREESPQEDRTRREKIWRLMAKYSAIDMESIQCSIVRHVEYTLCKNRFNFGNTHCYQAVAHSIRDRLLESFNDTQQHMHTLDVKRVYYLSLEYLLGRAMQNSLINLRLEQEYKDALMDIGYKLEELYDEEVEPALGNGGLGRLAACFLDSLATLNYPAWAYGIRYNYGIFRQKLVDGYQVEVPDYWLQYGNPWEVQRPDVIYPVKFYGRVETYVADGQERCRWEDGENVIAEAYDNIIPGYNTFNTMNLRLWKSIPTSEFDFSLFNQGDYTKAVETRQRAEYISSVLYPNDSNQSGKELRLKQQYFFVSATLQDIIRRFKKRNRSWKEFPSKAAIQLNDTHPALAIVELLRLLIDKEGLSHEEAFTISHQTFSYTNHTVLPEALETWTVGLMQHLLPRHLQLIYLLNHYWLEKVEKHFPGDIEKRAALSIIQEGPVKMVRMAHLSVVGSHTVNGVAQLHTQLIKTTLFHDFNQMKPKKFQNKTNGVTPRRWIRCCNPWLSGLYDKHLDNTNQWLLDAQLLQTLMNKKNDKAFQVEWSTAKQACKDRLARWVQTHCGVTIDPSSLFDIQIKRIHEYKRQLMNALYVVHRYLSLKHMSPEERRKTVPRTVLFGGKAAPGYTTAKQVIKLITSLQETINNDSSVGALLKVVYVPNYNVTSAQILIPASDLSQHISTAGMEASGTSNMKFVINGGLIIGTMDGANVEIHQQVGDENIFIFGADVNKVQRVFEALESGMFGAKGQHTELLNSIRNRNDHYLVLHDFPSYLAAQERVDKAYLDTSRWRQMSITNALLCTHRFSTDRTITQYAQDIWHINKYPVPNPSDTPLNRVRSKSSLEGEQANMEKTVPKTDKQVEETRPKKGAKKKREGVKKQEEEERKQKEGKEYSVIF